jgi:hypothetical protein
MPKPGRLALSLCALLCLALRLAASPSGCTIHPKKGASKAQLSALSKVSEADARKAALAFLGNPSGAAVEETELEAEHGCLVWSFDIRLQGKAGVQEIQVDAGDGRILSSAHESPKAEADEKARDRAKP